MAGAIGNACTFGDEIVEALRDTDNDLVVDDPLYYRQDDLFSVQAITDASGAVVERYDYSDYGEVTVQRPDGTVKPEEYWLGNRHTYTGRLVEGDTGLLQYRHRYMAPAIGRFVQRDPLGYVDGMSEVVYVRAHPASTMDPPGLGWICKRPLGSLPINLPINTPLKLPFGRPIDIPTHHEQVWPETPDGLPDTDDNRGFFPRGIDEETDRDYANGLTNYSKYKFFPNGAALREAMKTCARKDPYCRGGGGPGFGRGVWPPGGFNGGGYWLPGISFRGRKYGNRQTYADCVRREYYKLINSGCYFPMSWRPDPRNCAPMHTHPEMPAELLPSDPGGPQPGSRGNPVLARMR